LGELEVEGLGLELGFWRRCRSRRRRGGLVRWGEGRGEGLLEQGLVRVILGRVVLGRVVLGRGRAEVWVEDDVEVGADVVLVHGSPSELSFQVAQGELGDVEAPGDAKDARGDGSQQIDDVEVGGRGELDEE
jgi:hypothetical protein